MPVAYISPVRLFALVEFLILLCLFFFHSFYFCCCLYGGVATLNSFFFFRGGVFYLLLCGEVLQVPELRFFSSDNPELS